MNFVRIKIEDRFCKQLDDPISPLVWVQVWNELPAKISNEAWRGVNDIIRRQIYSKLWEQTKDSN